MKKLFLLSFALAWLALSQGCAPLPAEPGFIAVESEPAGADVVVMGEQKGRTPLRLRLEDVFPVTYPPAKSALYGKVVLKKEGCRDFVQSIDTKVYARGLFRAKLDCGARPPAMPGGQTGGTTESTEERLRRLKELREKGLITEEEEKATRRRILDEL